MEGFIEDFGVYTPDHYMYIDDYEHPIDYIHRTYYEVLKRIHLRQVEEKRHIKRKEVDVQIYPDICICCRNHSGKPDQIKLQQNYVKNLNRTSTRQNLSRQNLTKNKSNTT